MRLLVPVFVAFVIVAELARGQALPAFDVASVKPNRSGDGGVFIQIQPSGRFVATNATLRFLIQAAYATATPVGVVDQFHDFQIVGGAAWLDSDHFDIDARAEGAASPAQVTLMLRTLLGERFKLTTHQETLQLPMYELVRAGNDGQTRAQIRSAIGNCVTVSLVEGAPRPPEDAPRCGFRFESGRENGIRMIATGQSMDRLAQRLPFYVRRVVRNSTGLAGAFDFEIEFTPERRGIPPPADPAATERQIDAGVSIFTALQEQLGLRLESRTGPVAVLVVDGAALPTAN